MNKEKIKSLNVVYNQFIKTSLNEIPYEGSENFIDQNIMAYGTAADEKIF